MIRARTLACVLFALALLPLAALAQSAPPTTATATLTYVAPTKNTDGSAITGPITYNLYAAAQGATPVKVAAGITGAAVFTLPLASIPAGGVTECFALAAVVGGFESVLSSPLACKLIAAPPIPNGPSSIAISITFT